MGGGREWPQVARTTRCSFMPKMKIVTYDSTNPWTGHLACGACGHLTPAWRSSGMSQLFPHFYCNRCSNVIHRRGDQALVREQSTPELLKKIAATLPDCPCGGRFTPGANPKCQKCGWESTNWWTVVTRLGDPNMVVVDGACVFSDSNEPYQLRIED